MNKESLDVYDIRPEAMNNYLRYNGRHFSKKLCNWAVSQMKKSKDSAQLITKTQIDEMLRNNGIVIQNNSLYDYIYVANYCKLHLHGSSISDDLHMLKYIKDIIDDEDSYDGCVFNRWYSDMCGKGIPIDWEEVL